jgi:hypothetical protein
MSKNAFSNGFQPGDSDGYISDISQTFPIGDPALSKNMGNHSVQSLLEFFWKVFTGSTQSVSIQVPPVGGSIPQMVENHAVNTVMRTSDNLSGLSNPILSLQNIKGRSIFLKINSNFTTGGGAIGAPTPLPDPGAYNANYDIVAVQHNNYFRLPSASDSYWGNISDGMVITIVPYDASALTIGIVGTGTNVSVDAFRLAGTHSCISFVYDAHIALWRVYNSTNIS